MFYCFLKTQQQPDYYAFDKILQWTTEPPKDDGVYFVKINRNSTAYCPKDDKTPRLFVYEGNYCRANLNEDGIVSRQEANEICTHWLGALPVPDSPRDAD